MVARARKARVRKSSEASESRGEAGEKAGVSLSANSLSPVLPSFDLTEEGLLAVYLASNNQISEHSREDRPESKLEFLFTSQLELS